MRLLSGLLSLVHDTLFFPYSTKCKYLTMVFHLLKSSYQKVKQALAKTRDRFSQKIRSLFSRDIDEKVLEELEQLLYEADLGVQTAHELTTGVKKRHKQNPGMTPQEHIEALKLDILKLLNHQNRELREAPGNESPTVILIVGVNGNGKTTTIAKLAKQMISQGKKVLVAAGDTFRAAAIEQLDLWAQRVGASIVKTKPHSDPASVAFDAISAAKSRNLDIVIIDTAGRLQTKTALMEELAKIRRTCDKIHPGSPHETLLILDATTGQNALDQAKIFHQYTPLTGLILTKVDGTAKGGLVVNIQKEMDIPVKFIGVGESEDDLEPFNPQNFVNAFFE